MRFWDTSALVPLLLTEPATRDTRRLLTGDSQVVVWWGAWLECHSALARAHREQRIQPSDHAAAVRVAKELFDSAFEIQPGDEVRARARALLDRHPLRAADALQLAAALLWRGDRLSGGAFVCLDQRLREAAAAEAFDTLP